MKAFLLVFRSGLSDRNPTWPLKLISTKVVSMLTCLSDRNPTWPLKHAGSPAQLYL